MDLTNLSIMDAVIVMITIALMLFAGCLVYAIGANQLFKMIKDEKTTKTHEPRNRRIHRHCCYRTRANLLIIFLEIRLADRT